MIRLINAGLTRREFVVTAASMVALAGGGLLLAPSEAYANTAYGSQISTTKGGITYYGKCMVGNGNGSAVTGYAITSASSAVATGHIGALVKVYNTSGRFMGSKEAYNAVSTQYFNVQTDAFATANGAYYYAEGVLYAWDTYGYARPKIPRTPNVGRSLSPFVIDEFPVNSDGLTYGSLLSADYVGEEPDLVSAVSETGTEGYVRLGDLSSPLPRTPEEAVALYGDESVKIIPLLDLDSNQIDELILRYGGGTYEPFGMI